MHAQFEDQPFLNLGPGCAGATLQEKQVLLPEVTIPVYQGGKPPLQEKMLIIIISVL